MTNKKNAYATPVVEVAEMEVNTNILQASLGNGDPNDVELSDGVFDGMFHSNKNVWDL